MGGFHMWYKLDELEEKYGLNKLSVYKLITQEPELRQYFKSMEGVLQINEQGIGILLKHTSKEPVDKSPATLADNNTIILKKEDMTSSRAMENKVVSEVAEPKIDVVAEKKSVKEYDEDIDLFADAFNTSGSFFDIEDDKAVVSSLAPEESFFSNVDIDYKEEEESVNEEEEPKIELETDFSEGLIFQDVVVTEDDMAEAEEVNVSIYDDTAPDDFFSDEPIDDSKFLNFENSVVKEIKSATVDDYSMEGYIKALKEKLIIQNEQIRAISNYLEVTKRLLIQDEKIVNIIEGMNKK
jgi:folate-dependent phosphoribosylglycinamide formyltransferase PurN